MNASLFVRILSGTAKIHPDTKVSWFTLNESKEINHQECLSSIESFTKDYSHTVDGNLPSDIIVLLPAEIASIRVISINEGQRKHLATVLPFLLEEELISDLDSLHLAYTQPDTNNQLSVGIAAHSDISALLEVLHNAGITATHLYVESQLIAASTALGSMILHDERITLRTADAVCTLPIHSVTSDSTQYLLPAGLTEDSAQQSVIILNKSRPNDNDHLLSDWVQNTFNLPVAASGTINKWLAKSYRQAEKNTLVNLLQGRYKPPGKRHKSLKAWKPALIVALCWFVLDLGITTAKGFLLQQKSHKSWMNSAEAYLEAFPRDQQVLSAVKRQNNTVNLKSRLSSRLKPTSPESGTTSVLPILQQLSVVYSSFDDLKITPASLDYDSRNNRLIFEFQTQDLERIEKFQTALKSSGLDISLDSAQKEGRHVTARMTIRS